MGLSKVVVAAAWGLPCWLPCRQQLALGSLATGLVAVLPGWEPQVCDACRGGAAARLGRPGSRALCPMLQLLQWMALLGVPPCQQTGCMLLVIWGWRPAPGPAYKRLPVVVLAERQPCLLRAACPAQCAAASGVAQPAPSPHHRVAGPTPARWLRTMRAAKGWLLGMLLRQQRCRCHAHLGAARLVHGARGSRQERWRPTEMPPCWQASLAAVLVWEGPPCAVALLQRCRCRQRPAPAAERAPSTTAARAMLAATSPGRRRLLRRPHANQG